MAKTGVEHQISGVSILLPGNKAHYVGSALIDQPEN
jgi:hypothetical protein